MLTTTASWTDRYAAAASARGWASETWSALGTSVELVVAEPAALDEARRRVDDLLDAVDRAASRFRDDSELTAVNRAAGAWTDVSPLLAGLLRIALDAAAWTDGLVDPTVGGTLAGLGYDRTFRLVSADAPATGVTALPVPGWRQVELDDDALRVRLAAGTSLDLGATAKAAAADQAAAAVLAHTGSPCLVSLGGDVAVVGDPPEGGWPVRVADTAGPYRPADPVAAGHEQEQTVALTAGGLATSSTTARRWRRGGRALHHLVDPRTGGVADAPWRTATVSAVTCTLANTASTAAVVLGADAPGWLDARGLPYRLVAQDGALVRGNGWPAP